MSDKVIVEIRNATIYKVGDLETTDVLEASEYLQVLRVKEYLREHLPPTAEDLPAFLVGHAISISNLCDSCEDEFPVEDDEPYWDANVSNHDIHQLLLESLRMLSDGMDSMLPSVERKDLVTKLKKAVGGVMTEKRMLIKFTITEMDGKTETVELKFRRMFDIQQIEDVKTYWKLQITAESLEWGWSYSHARSVILRTVQEGWSEWKSITIDSIDMLPDRLGK